MEKIRSVILSDSFFGINLINSMMIFLGSSAGLYFLISLLVNLLLALSFNLEFYKRKCSNHNWFDEFGKKYFLLMFSLILTVVTALGSSYLLKYLILRPRPILETALLIKDTPAFPSTHAVIASAVLFLFLSKRIQSLQWSRILILKWFVNVLMISLMSLIIISGFYNGVHYLSDVFGGIIIGLIIGYFLNKIYLKLILL